MPEVNPIYTNTASVTNADIKDSKAKKEENKEEEKVVNTEAKNLPEKDIFDYMANSGLAAMANVNMSPAARVSKYTSAEASERIGAMMGAFETGVASVLNKWQEYGGEAFNKLSEENQMALAAKWYADNNWFG